MFPLTVLEIEAPSLRLGGEVLPSPSKVGLRGRLVCAGPICGEALTTYGGTVRLSVKGAIARSYPGDAQVMARSGSLVAVVNLDLEDAVAGAVAGEMPGTPLKSAIDAQAIAARSYYSAHRRRHEAADFCDSTHCQFLTAGTAVSRESALRTRGLVLRYRGEPVPALYFRSCGGRTLRAEDVGFASSPYPFAAVDCAACLRNPAVWTAQFPEEQWTGQHTEAARLELARRFGWDSLRSNDYIERRVAGKVIVSGKGHGHGVGLCQRGAAGMAAQGADFRSILRHYFPAASIVE
ncbi:MAG: hypothetical protein JNK48_01570 [Bryobacterales bacterium]|nr:hypothetical protein [Bryobacterales bacterium]